MLEIIHSFSCLVRSVINSAYQAFPSWEKIESVFQNTVGSFGSNWHNKQSTKEDDSDADAQRMLNQSNNPIPDTYNYSSRNEAYMKDGSPEPYRYTFLFPFWGSSNQLSKTPSPTLESNSNKDQGNIDFSFGHVIDSTHSITEVIDATSTFKESSIQEDGDDPDRMSTYSGSSSSGYLNGISSFVDSGSTSSSIESDSMSTYWEQLQ